MEEFIIGNGFVLDEVIYELVEKLEFGVMGKYLSDSSNYRYSYLTNKEMEKAESIPF